MSTAKAVERLDRKIRIYWIDVGVDSDGNQVRTKCYLNPNEDTYFMASYRELSSKELLANKELKLDATAQFKINRRKIEEGYFIEFKRPIYGLKTYAVTSVDPFEDRLRGRYTLKVKEVRPAPFDEVRWAS